MGRQSYAPIRQQWQQYDASEACMNTCIKYSSHYKYIKGSSGTKGSVLGPSSKSSLTERIISLWLMLISLGDQIVIDACLFDLMKC